MTDGGGTSVVRRSPIRRRCWSCTAIHCVHIARQLHASNLITSQSKDTGTNYVRNLCTYSSFEVPLNAGWSIGRTDGCFVLLVIILSVSVICFSYFWYWV